MQQSVFGALFKNDANINNGWKMVKNDEFNFLKIKMLLNAIQNISFSFLNNLIDDDSSN